MRPGQCHSDSIMGLNQRLQQLALLLLLLLQQLLCIILKRAIPLARTILISNFVGKHSRFDKRAQSRTAQSKMSQFDKAHIKVFLLQP